MKGQIKAEIIKKQLYWYDFVFSIVIEKVGYLFYVCDGNFKINGIVWGHNRDGVN